MAVGTAKKELTQQQSIFLAALRQTLPALRNRSDQIVAERIGQKKLQEVCDDLFGFIDSAVIGTLTQAEYFALSCQVLRALASYLKEAMNMPATINTIPNQMGLLEWAVDEAFPGYAEAKLLKYTIKPVR